MNDLEHAKKQLGKAAVHLERVYPTDQLIKGIEDIQAVMGLDIDLPPLEPVVDGHTDFEEECSKLVSAFDAANTWLQMATNNLANLRRRLDNIQ